MKYKSIIAILVIFTIIGIIFSFVYTNPKYVAESVVLFKTNNTPENYVLTDNLFNTYKEIIKNDSTYNQINNGLKLNITNKDFNKAISVVKVANSNTMKIQVKNKRQEVALEIDKYVNNVFSDKFSEIYSDIEIINIEEAHIIGQINDRNAIIIVIISVLIGLLFSLIYISIISKEGAKVSKETEKEIKLKQLAEIPINKTNIKIMQENNNFLREFKAFDELRTVIQFLNFDKNSKKSILLSSINEKEGKSYISANLAINYALSGKKVILIDADMDTGVQNKLFNVPNNIGISNYLSNLNGNGIEIDELISKYVKETSIKNLNIITSGTVPPNSTELLASDKLEKLLNELDKFFDIIIIDGTSVLSNTNSLILSRFVKSTILITTFNKTTKEELEKARKDIQNIGGTILGVVINRVKIRGIKLTTRISNFFSNIKIKIKNYFYNKSVKALPEGTGKIENVVIIQNEKINTKEQDTIIEKGDIIEDVNKENNKEIEEIQEKNKEEIKENDIKEEVSETDIKENKSDEKDILPEENIPEENTIETQKESVSKFKFIKNSFINLKNNIVEKKDILKEKLKRSKKEDNTVDQAEESFETLIKENLENNEEIIINKYDEPIKEEINYYEQLSIEPKIEEQIQPQQEDNLNIPNNIELNNEELEKYLNDDNTIIVFVDVKNACCRIFGKECFIEKPIRTINAGNQNQPFYSKDFIKKYKNRLKNNYSLNEEQIKRIDLLIYTSLREYDDALWTDKRMESFKAEAYVKVMSKDYFKFVGESDQDYNLRIRRDRRLELAKSYIDIEYILDDIWKFNKMKLNDKIILQRYANELEIQDLLKNDFEKIRSRQNKIFYNNIVSATNEFRVNEANINNDTERILEKIKENNRQEMEDNSEERNLEEEIIEKQKRFKREKTRIDKIEERKAKKAEKEERKKKAKEAKKKAKQVMQEKRELQKEEARIEEELLTNNLYPKTKYYKDL